MLTPEQKAEIRRLHISGNSIFRICTKTGHDPKTIRKYLAIKTENLRQSLSSEDTQETLVNITLEAGFISEMVMDKAIQPDYPVLVPVPMEIAEEYINIKKVSGSKLRKIGEVLGEAIDKAIQEEQYNKKV